MLKNKTTEWYQSDVLDKTITNIISHPSSLSSENIDRMNENEYCTQPMPILTKENENFKTSYMNSAANSNCYYLDHRPQQHWLYDPPIINVSDYSTSALSLSISMKCDETKNVDQKQSTQSNNVSKMKLFDKLLNSNKFIQNEKIVGEEENTISNHFLLDNHSHHNHYFHYPNDNGNEERYFENSQTKFAKLHWRRASLQSHNNKHNRRQSNLSSILLSHCSQSKECALRSSLSLSSPYGSRLLSLSSRSKWSNRCCWSSFSWCLYIMFLLMSICFDFLPLIANNLANASMLPNNSSLITANNISG